MINFVRFKSNQLEIVTKILIDKKTITFEKNLLKLAKLAGSLCILNISTGNEGKKKIYNID